MLTFILSLSGNKKLQKFVFKRIQSSCVSVDRIKHWSINISFESSQFMTELFISQMYLKGFSLCTINGTIHRSIQDYERRGNFQVQTRAFFFQHGKRMDTHTELKGFFQAFKILHLYVKFVTYPFRPQAWFLFLEPSGAMLLFLSDFGKTVRSVNELLPKSRHVQDRLLCHGWSLPCCLWKPAWGIGWDRAGVAK